MKHLRTYENITNKEKFKVGEYAICIPFNIRVKILEVTDQDTIWIENEDGHVAEFLINKDFVPELEFNANKYNI